MTCGLWLFVWHDFLPTTHSEQAGRGLTALLKDTSAAHVAAAVFTLAFTGIQPEFNLKPFSLLAGCLTDFGRNLQTIH